MALISETSYDGSNGGDLNKKPDELNKNPPEEEEEEEEENQNENPNEEDHQEDEIENLPPIPRHIPENLIERTVARIRSCHYPKLSLISRSFRRVMYSQELFVARSQLALTEPVLYTLIKFRPSGNSSWFILHRSKISLRLSEITSFPPMFQGSTVVTMGHKMYVMGGYNSSLKQRVKTVIVINCRYHTYHEIRTMRKSRVYAAAGVIDGKIYVVGGRTRGFDEWVEVFDVENGIWESVTCPYPLDATMKGKFPIHMVMDNKIYMVEGQFCFAYDPRQRTWETWHIGNHELSLFWHAPSCVVDDLFYAIDTDFILGSPIVVLDPRVMVWRPVKVVDFWPGLVYSESTVANFGGNLVVLGCYQSRLSSDHSSKKNVWCVEVTLEKSEDGDIWGKVESLWLVHSFPKSPFFEHSRAVTV